MHGIGLKLSSKHVTVLAPGGGGGDEVIEGPCTRAARLAARQKAAYHAERAVYDELRDIFGDKVSTQVRLIVLAAC